MTRAINRRHVVAVTVLAASVSLAACGNSDESNLDVLAEWRKNAPSTTVSESSPTGSSVQLPTLPEGADPFAPENYRIAAIRSYMTARGHVLALIELAGEFDLGSEAWATGMRDLAAKFNEEAAFFAKLNPPAEYTEKQGIMVASMGRISTYVKDLDDALTAGDFNAGADALAAIQEETNTLVQNGRFDYIGPSSGTTVAP